MNETAYATLEPVKVTANDIKSPYAEQIKNWTTYTHYLSGFAGVVKLTDDIVAKFISDEKTKEKVDGALHAVYAAVQGVDKEFVDGIKSMQAGKKPQYEFPPSNIPDWPAKDNKNIFQAAWQIVEPALEVWQSKVGGSSTFSAAIAGLISAGDECVKILNDAFGK